MLEGKYSRKSQSKMTGSARQKRESQNFKHTSYNLY